MYAEASRLHAAVCLARIGASDLALEELAAFYRDHPEGLHRGEALKLMGDLQLQARWEPAAAREAYRRAVEWTEIVRRRGRLLETHAIPAKSKALATPPGEWQRLRPSGEIERLEVPAHALVNRATAPWYLDRLQAEAEYALGFLAAVDGDWDAAFAHFDRVTMLDPVLRQADGDGFFNAIDRLRRSRIQGAIAATPAELAGLRPKESLAVQWADFLLIRSDFEQALSLYGRLRACGASARRSELETRALLGEALALGAAQDSAVRKLPLAATAGRHPNAPSAPYLWLLAGLHARGGERPGEPGLLDCLRRVYTRHPTSHLAPRARYEEIRLGVAWEDAARRAAMVGAFARDHPGHPLLETLRGYDQAVSAHARAGSNLKASTGKPETTTRNKEIRQ